MRLLIAALMPGVAAPLPAGAVLLPDETISGTVTNSATGAPIAGATVYAEAGECPQCDRWNATTDSLGRYSVWIPEFSYPYRVSAVAEGYVTNYLGEILLSPADMPLNIRLDRPGEVRGNVYQANGTTALPGATVEIVSPTNAERAYSAGTANATGAYTTAPSTYSTQQQTGDYLVRAYMPGYELEYYANKTSAATATRVRVPVNTTVSSINFTLARAGRISGHVYAADGVTPLAWATVNAYLPGQWSAPVDTAYTLTDGSYMLDGGVKWGLSPGPYYVVASKSGYQDIYYPNSTSAAGASPVNVVTAADTTGIDFTLVTAGGISGMVYLPDGTTPFAGARIFIYREPYEWNESTPVAELVSEADGSFTSGAALQTAGYSLRYEADGYLSEWYDNRWKWGDFRDIVQVTSPAITTGISIQLRPAGSIAGHAYRTDGVTPMKWASVCIISLFAPFPYTFYTCTDANDDGSYLLADIPADTYYLFAVESQDWGFPAPIEYYDNKPSRETADPFVLAPGAQVTGIDFTMGWECYIFMPFVPFTVTGQ